ncbi:ribonuclease H-like protein, partial [Aureobasidium melanogenum]
MARTGQQLPFGQSILDFDDLQTLGQEIVQLCDGIEKTGLVDYQMGVAEERIVDCDVVEVPNRSASVTGGYARRSCLKSNYRHHSKGICMAGLAVPILEGAAARSNLSSQASAYCEKCELTWMVAAPGFADQEDVFQDCPFHDSLEADCAERRTPSIHVDGACPGNGTKSAVGGIDIYFGPSSPYNLSALVARKISQPPTSQQAELTAATRALEIIREKCMPTRRQLVETYILFPCHTECWAMSFPFRVIIITDSAHLYDCMTSHLMVWRWDPKTQVYTNKKSGSRDAGRERGVQVLWKKVPRAMNLEADRLAKAGAKM